MHIQRTQNAQIYGFPARTTRSWQGQPRFGATPDVSDANMDRVGTELHDMLKEAEKHPGKFKALIEKVVGGDTGLGRSMTKALEGLLKQIPVERSCKRIQGEGGLEVHVKTGPREVVYKNRTNIVSSEEMTFQEYLASPQVFGDKDRVIVSFTGWTLPPAHYLLQNANLRKKLQNMDKADWPKVAEGYYVALIKQFMTLVVDELKKKGYSKDNLGFVYGVSTEGVDRAIEEFSKENRIACAGVTTYDWLEPRWVPDDGDRPPIYLVHNAKQFGQCLSAFSKVVVTGGRNFAATVDQSGRFLGVNNEDEAASYAGYKAISFDHKLIPADLMRELGGIIVDPVVLSDKDGMTTVVENAPALLEACPVTNPDNWPDIKIDRGSTVPRCVQVLSQILARELDNQKFFKKGLELVDQVHLQDDLARAKGES